jgi:thiosulfate reductase cytochrome b subunit
VAEKPASRRLPAKFSGQRKPTTSCHQAGRYNAIQRLAYVVVLLLGMLAVASGLALWKPVQMSTLAVALGGYEAARRLHFVAMAGIVTFTTIHLVMVMLIPRTLIGMITGRVGVDTAREVPSDEA